MTPPAISPEIIQTRQQKAAHLKRILAACDTLAQRLAELKAAMSCLDGLDSPAFQSARADIDALLGALQHPETGLGERVALRRQRFENGRVTVSIAGLEKAGKTTFLKSLTGIAELPAFDERCTAVCCEILYDADRADFDMEFHTESEFLDRVIRPIVETAAAGLPDDLSQALPLPRTADAFQRMPLPAPEKLPGGTTAYKLLKDLMVIQRHFNACRAYLDHPPLLRRPLNQLGDWVSYQKAQVDDPEDADQRGRHLAQVSAAKACRIHTAFPGGSAHLRWIDTPGVDDPNRRAREQTLSTIAAETDLLVIVSRPGASPSPTESFHRFWDSVSRQPDEVDLLSRMLFTLNLDRRVDPLGENIRIHRKYLMDAGVPEHLFIGPLEAIQQADAAALMQAVNAHLKAHLGAQDDRAILAFDKQLKTIMARVRLLLNDLARIHPSDADLNGLESEAFYKWFHWYSADGERGFWTDLVAALETATRLIAEDERIQESESRLIAIFAEEAKQIQSAIPTPEALADYGVKQRGENPIPSGMRHLSILFSRLVNRLAGEIQEFGPIMQEKLVQVFESAGLGPLLKGADTCQRLKHLLDCLGQGADGASAVIQVIREGLELPRNLKYVIRYELRPAVDFCDPTLWNAREDARTRLTEMVKANGGDVNALARFETYRHPPVTDDRIKDHDLLRRMAANALIGIQAALGNGRNLPRRIADDFIRDCRIRLCFSPESEQEWRTLLFRSRGLLLSGPIGRIRERSERIRGFQNAVQELEGALG